MNISFSVCMMLESVNRMGTGIRGAMQQVSQLKQRLGSVPKNITSTVKIKKIEETVKVLRERSSKEYSTAMKEGATGVAILAPIAKTIKDFAEVEDSFTNLKIASYDSSIPIQKMGAELKKAQAEAERLGDKTRFSTREAVDSMTTLVKGGADLKDVYSGLAEASLYLAQVSNIDPSQSADTIMKIANAYQLSGEKMKSAADIISRASDASAAGPEEVQIGFKYSSGMASLLGQTVKDNAQVIAVLNNRGLDGSTAGTNYADMLRNLIPKRKPQIEAMDKLGWLDRSGKSVFFDSSGKIKSMLEVIKIMRRSLKGMRPDDQARLMQSIFQDEGSRAVLALIKEGQGGWEETGSKMQKAKPLNEKVKMQNQTLKGRFENMMGSLANLSANSGEPVGGFISERLDGITDAINKTREWSKLHPKVVKGIMWIVTSLGLLKIGSAAFHLLKGGALGFKGNLLSVVGGIKKITGGIKDWKAGFDLVREAGGGIWKSIAKGAGLAWPKFGKSLSIGRKIGGVFKIGGIKGLEKLKSLIPLGKKLGGVFKSGGGKAIGWILRLGKTIVVFTAGWLVQAARIAVGWLIAMGPVGWVILGVTALIVAGIILWKTNFMGFRDKCIYVWNAISSWGKKTWIGITGFVKTAIDRVSSFIDRVRTALGLASQLDNPHALPGPIDRQSLKTPDIPYLNPDRGNKTNKFYQKNNITVKDIEEAARFTRKAPPPKYTLGNSQFNIPK